MKYVYAIVPAARADQEHEPLAFASLDGRFELATDGEFAALISDSSIDDFAGLPRGQLMRYLALHQRAVEALMVDSPVLPVKFGTLLADAEQVRAVLYLGQHDLRSAFEMVGSRFEMDVAVTWEPACQFAEIAQEPRVATLKVQVAGLSAEQQLEGRIALGQLVKEVFDSRRNQLRDALLTELTPCTSRWRLNPLMDDSMVMNVACLVDAAEGEILEDRVCALDQQHNDRLHFRLVGPLPPYSFATVEARVVGPGSVAQACSLLDLPGEQSTPEQVKHAYYRQARLYHPDVVGDDAPARARFVSLTEAYRLMTEVALRVPAGDMPDNGTPYILVRTGGPGA